MAVVQCGDVAMPNFDTMNTSDLGCRWRKWVRGYKLLASGWGIVNPEQMRDLLLGLAGEEVQDIFDTLVVPDEEDDGPDAFVRALTALNTYFEPQVNVPYERSVFRRCGMSEGEPMASYVTRLRRLAASCDFGDAEEAIRDQVIEKTRSQRHRRKLLEQGGDLRLGRVLELARAEETVDAQVAMYAGHDREVNALQHTPMQAPR